MDYVYAIQVINKRATSDAGRVSSEAYPTLSKAQTFIESRFDKPEKFTEYIYESEENIYLIYQLKIFN